MEDNMAVSEASDQPLGVGTLLNDTFSLYFKRIHWFAALAFGPLVITSLVLVSLFGAVVLTGDFNFEAYEGPGASVPWGAIAIGMLLYTATVAISAAMVTTAAHDAKLGRPVRLGFYFTTALHHLVPVLFCALIATILVYLGFVLVLVPGLWVLAVFFVIVPAIVLEDAGFGAFGRSSRLTKGYRWPIVGYVLVLGVCMFIINTLTGLIITPVVALLGDFVGPQHTRIAHRTNLALGTILGSRI
jgi:hypothetical protein